MPGDRNTTHGRRRLWATLAALAAVIAVGLPVSGALAGGGGGSGGDRPDAGGASIQTQQQRQDDRRHDGDCPGKNRGQDGAGGSGTDASVEL